MILGKETTSPAVATEIAFKISGELSGTAYFTTGNSPYKNYFLGTLELIIYLESVNYLSP